ncbi:LysR family transcriptional regulator [Glaciimonas immobilis]|uniref:DNA-binding transcriptional LysR family regulator n=1 Tax=Glaciimonas immobilis TaxID=728004 RepID=A0A840RU40_9BURK|nr:LysR family transcriptional regulator [Glaciimonas immobilis]KAF3996489.1 LysR family transcriptional regulator [Glaciimonas immobilis]MBB5201153.1 DNA-binding transcriptional LysR family regulator [Glaciimonas immobilis]
MKRVTLINLETLCWISRLGTFNAAALKMNASPPAISARVREMEAALGVTLFRRQGRRMALTFQGRELVQMVEPLLRRLDGVVGDLDNPEAASGTVRIGAGEIAALSWFSTFIAELRQIMPKVVYQIEIDLTTSMRQRLETGKLDIALFAAPAVGADMRSASLGWVRMCWMMAPALQAKNLAPGTLRERLEAHAIWSLSKPSASHSMTMDLLRDQGVDSDGIGTCNNISALIAIIASGAGIALLPEILVRSHVARGELVPLMPELKMPELEFVIAWNTDQEQLILRNIVDVALRCTTFDMLSTP